MARGVFIVGAMCGGGHVWRGGMCGGGDVWQGACMAGGMHGRWACMTEECAWQGVCMARGGMCGRRDDHWSGHILLECILGFRICNYHSVFL